MFSDTHFHFHHLVENNGQQFGTDILEQMARNKIYFGLDIGTRRDDLASRAQVLEDCLFALSDVNMQSKLRKSLYLSAGIWPDPDSIEDRYSAIETLKESIEDFMESDSIFARHLCAIGEGGIDHHWNPSGADHHCREDYDEAMFYGEKELFGMQLELAREFGLPFIIHSRDGFEDTMDVLRAIRYNKGIVHCFSYGKNEAKQFLDMGWYIALGGGLTYTKKNQMDDLVDMLNYLPKDRIVLETDSPYLAPVPLRGQENNPLNIKYTYDFVSAKLGISTDKLDKIVDENIRTLFNLKA